MRMAVYVRVSTQQQAQSQTIEQQLERLRLHCQAQQWPWQDVQVFRDEGYSGATLRRPGLDRFRDQAANGGCVAKIFKLIKSMDTLKSYRCKTCIRCTSFL